MTKELLFNFKAPLGFFISQALITDTKTRDFDFPHKQKKAEFHKRNFDIESNIDLYKDEMIIKEFLYKFRIGMLRDALFTGFREKHREELRILIRLLLSAEDFITFYKTACWCRLYLNRGMFITALTTIRMSREDGKKIILPPIYEVCLFLFFDVEIIDETKRIKMMTVCKRWHGVSAKGWHCTSEINLPEKFSKKQVHVILKRCGRFLRKLNITIGNKCIDCLPMIFKFCQLKRLEEFHVRYRHLDNKSARNSKNLTKLFKESTELKSIEIGGILDDDYHEEFSNVLALRNLRKLEISNEYGESRYSSEWLFFRIKLDEFPNLHELSFYGVILEVEDEKNNERSKNPMKGLETLTMEDCEIPKEFSVNLKLFTNLKKLDLRSVDGIEKEDVLGIAQNCQNLMTLYLLDCDYIESCFEDLGAMPSLITLGFSQPRSTSNGTSIKYLTNVENLEIYSTWHPIRSCDGLLHLITHSVKLQNLNFYVRAGDGCLRARIANIFVQELRKLPLHLTIRMVSRCSGDPAYSYDGPEHPSLKVTVV